MTRDEMVAVFEKENDEFLKFAFVEKQLSKRKDLHAFILLDKLVPEGNTRIVAGAEHDEIWLGVDPRKLAEVVTRDQLVELIRCGVRWSAEFESLCMFA